jgi:hypothetical protein
MEVWRIESKDSVSEPGEAEGSDLSPRAAMIKRKEDAWRKTPRRADRAHARAPAVEVELPPPPGFDPGEPDASGAREQMIARIKARSSAPRRPR